MVNIVHKLTMFLKMAKDGQTSSKINGTLSFSSCDFVMGSELQEGVCEIRDLKMNIRAAAIYFFY